MQQHDFSGVWRSIHYKTCDGVTSQTEHYMMLRAIGNELVMESLSSISGSYLLARFTLDGNVATGSYQSQRVSHKPNDNALSLYHGAAQLILEKNGKAFRGQGVGYDRHMEVQSTIWEVVRIGQHVASSQLTPNNL